jgi:hypothetical protein
MPRAGASGETLVLRALVVFVRIRREKWSIVCAEYL